MCMVTIELFKFNLINKIAVKLMLKEYINIFYIRCQKIQIVKNGSQIL